MVVDDVVAIRLRDEAGVSLCVFSPKRYEVGTTSKALKMKLIGMIGVHA